MSIIDTHAHIYSDQFKKDLDDMMSRSTEAGVQEIYMPNIDHTSIDAMLEVEAKYSNAYPMMGLHPCSVNKDFEKELYIVEEWLSKREFLAVGEIGIDLYWDKSFFEQQKEAFEIQVEWAKKYELPIAIHCRESFEETFDLLSSIYEEGLKGVFHCFTGTFEEAQKVISLGFYLGIGGVVTFKKSELGEVLKDIPLDHIVVETDSPYLAPTPYRGKRNEPPYIAQVVEKLSNVFEKPVDDIMSKTSRNARQLFKKLS